MEHLGGKMANMSMQRTGELVKKLFRILQKHQDGLESRDDIAALMGEVTRTPLEQGK